jgi:hypothetical protein
MHRCTRHDSDVTPHSDKYGANYVRDAHEARACVYVRIPEKYQLLLPDFKHNYNVFTIFMKK